MKIEHGAMLDLVSFVLVFHQPKGKHLPELKHKSSKTRMEYWVVLVTNPKFHIYHASLKIERCLLQLK